MRKKYRALLEMLLLPTLGDALTARTNSQHIMDYFFFESMYLYF
jgi:hypothetical protein